MFTDLLKRDQGGWGLTPMQTARKLGVSVEDFRAIEAGEVYPDSDAYEAIGELFGWAQAFVSPGGHVSYR